MAVYHCTQLCNMEESDACCLGQMLAPMLAAAARRGSHSPEKFDAVVYNVYRSSSHGLWQPNAANIYNI